MSTGDRFGRDRTGRSEQEQQAEGPAAELAQNRMQVARQKRSVMRKAQRAATPNGAKIPEDGGAPLGSEVRSRMEPKLGADLSSVRVHTGGESSEAATKLGARAFTVGSDVHFGAGQFAPGQRDGDRLLAHELTHVVQGQKSGIQRKAEEEAPAAEGDKGGDPEAAGTEGGEDAKVSDPAEPAEKEADSVADDVTSQLHGKDEKKNGKHDKKGEKKDGEKAEAQDDEKAEAQDDEKAEAQDGEKAEAQGGGDDAGGKAEAGDEGKGDQAAKTEEKPAAISAKLSGVGLKSFRDWIAFKDLPGPSKGPTTDPNHPHLKELGITKMGPYRYFPAKGQFQYTPPSDLADLWKDAEAGTDYEPEAPPTAQPGVTAAVKADRIAKAKEKFGPGLDAVLAHDDGKTPRPFTGVADEDVRGSALDAHNVARHCISGTSDMKSKDDVALRAGFGMIGGAVSGVYTPTASAFESPGAADAALAGPLNGALTANWATWKLSLANGKNPFSPVAGAGAAGAVVFKSVSGAPLPTDEVPKYLDPTKKGIAPLFAGDPRWQAWWDTNPQEKTTYETANGQGAKPPPITTDESSGASGTSMRVLSETGPTNGGWILHAAWPV